ncbi:DUF4304 domain-containing protein [Aeromicrobium fastidiosum]|nr:DUF4304 domain-containing protein [Aeromicrobium fastidiosum]MBP2391192.1 hypothetical protein [Aeromicrobium fastidiosum]
MAGASMQDHYRELVNGHLSPALRQRGFKGSAGRYVLPSATTWSLLELQKSAFSDRYHVRFTANLLVVSRSTWHHSGTAPTIASLCPQPGAEDERASAQVRLGMLASVHDVDDWWTVDPATDVATVAASFLTALDRHGMPWMKHRAGVMDRAG